MPVWAPNCIHVRAQLRLNDQGSLPLILPFLSTVIIQHHLLSHGVGQFAAVLTAALADDCAIGKLVVAAALVTTPECTRAPEGTEVVTATVGTVVACVATTALVGVVEVDCAEPLADAIAACWRVRAGMMMILTSGTTRNEQKFNGTRAQVTRLSLTTA